MLTPKQQYQKEYYQKNKEQRQQHRREYYQKNKEQHLTKTKEYYQNNKEQCVLRAKEYRKNNKEIVAVAQRKQYDKQETNPKTFIGAMFQHFSASAKSRGLEFTITREYLTEAVAAANGRCTISNVPLSTARNHPHRVSVDRIDSSKGYIPGNIQIVAMQVNFAKNKFDDLKWFDEMCRSRVKFLNKKGKCK